MKNYFLQLPVDVTAYIHINMDNILAEMVDFLSSSDNPGLEILNSEGMDYSLGFNLGRKYKLVLYAVPLLDSKDRIEGILISANRPPEVLFELLACESVEAAKHTQAFDPVAKTDLCTYMQSCVSYTDPTCLLEAVAVILDLTGRTYFKNTSFGG